MTSQTGPQNGPEPENSEQPWQAPPPNAEPGPMGYPWSLPPGPQGGQMPIGPRFPGAEGGPPGQPRRRRTRSCYIITSVAAAAVLVAVIALFALDDTSKSAGEPFARSSAGFSQRAIALQFIDLESRRYNVNGPTPPATRATYGAVSCMNDLAQMAATGPVLPPTPPHPRYIFSIGSISPVAGNPALSQLNVKVTDRAAGDIAIGHFSLQRESGSWKVCGLYGSTQPTPPSRTASTAPSASAGSIDRTGAGNSSGGGNMSRADAQAFLNDLAAAAGIGHLGTTASLVCVDDPHDDATVLSWAQSHARLMAHLDTLGTAGGSATVQVEQSGKPTTAWELVFKQERQGTCVFVLVRK